MAAFRPEIVEEVLAEEPRLRRWVASEIGNVLVRNEAETAVVGNLPDARLVPALVQDTLHRLEALAALDR